jgi:hypothetical protein
MNTPNEQSSENGPKGSGIMRVLSLERVAPGKVTVTTESKKYGQVTQSVLIFPLSVIHAEVVQAEAGSATEAALPCQN